MTLWFALALMTATAIFAVLWPLARRTTQRQSGSDVAVYRDQLDEIERDRAAGLIEDNEAAGAQVEVSRRLIAAGKPIQHGARTSAILGGDDVEVRPRFQFGECVAEGALEGRIDHDHPVAAGDAQHV